MLAELLEPIPGLPVPQWLANVRADVGGFWVAEVLAFADPDYPPLYVTGLIVAGPPAGFPYGVQVHGDH